MTAGTTERLTAVAPDVIFVPMLTPEKAVDLYLGDITRRDYSARTIDTYRRTLYQLCDFLHGDLDVSEVTTDHLNRFCNRWNGRKQRGHGTYSAGTRAGVEAALASFFDWLYFQDKIKRNPVHKLQRTRKRRSEDLDVVTVSTADVVRLLDAAEGWTEKLAVAIPAYLGPRRRAVAQLRLSDYDRARGRIRFREKGNKVIWKPVPDELVTMLEAAIADGAIKDPSDYLVPSFGKRRRAGERDDRVIWRAVGRVAERAHVVAHVHALRAAFAVFYLEQHPGDIEALQPLMGHRSIATTETYLRRLDRNQAMERVRDLSWGGNTAAPGFPQNALKRLGALRVTEKEGFEPSSPSNPHDQGAGTQRDADDLPEALKQAIPKAERDRV